MGVRLMRKRGGRMLEGRLEVRLDGALRAQLQELAEERQAPVAHVVRELIKIGYEELKRQRRLRAVEVLNGLEIEDVPDPEELSRQLAATYEPHL